MVSVLHASDDEARQRFKEEACVGNRLDEMHIDTVSQTTTRTTNADYPVTGGEHITGIGKETYLDNYGKYVKIASHPSRRDNSLRVADTHLAYQPTELIDKRALSQ